MINLISNLGQVIAVIGSQWGDEGKGKATDILAEQFDIIARACGGANAGHTIVVNDEKHVFHLLPSGCMHDKKIIFLGSGMVIHLPTLLEEIDRLNKIGIDIVPRLYIANSAHILLDFHKTIDGALEEQRSKKKEGVIGTTKRGIGPAYMDKAERVGLRAEGLKSSEATLKEYIAERAEVVEKRYGIKVDRKLEVKNLIEAKKLLGSRVVDNGPMFLNESLEKKKNILVEGAQATLLDTDHGTYPFVTSSSTTLAGALQGLGLAPSSCTTCVGIAKAYCTRVGSGFFPTEAEGETAERLRTKGGEFGATTGRPRRCGWLDLRDLQFGAKLNGITHWNITKIDVLDDEEMIPVAINEIDGKIKYKELEGWQSSTENLSNYDDMPEKAKAYIEFIEEVTKVPVALIGTGQGRSDIIIR
ncbi:adenylosuccinate synthase [Candidatus Peregrinibacteria bacterium]|nr:adenylosuccinate synthase [Candidatus Peregrinibacteria bacterium]